MRKWIKYRWVTVETGDFDGRGAENQSEEFDELKEIGSRFLACESCIEYAMGETKGLKLKCIQ